MNAVFVVMMCLFGQVQEGVPIVIDTSGRSGEAVTETREGKRLPEQADRKQQGQDTGFHGEILARAGRRLRCPQGARADEHGIGRCATDGTASASSCRTEMIDLHVLHP